MAWRFCQRKTHQLVFQPCILSLRRRLKRHPALIIYFWQWLCVVQGNTVSWDEESHSERNRCPRGAVFRARTVFKALLDDFTAYLLHGSHGTLGSIKTRQTTDTSTYFPLLNPLILVQSRARGEIQPVSVPIHVSPCPSSAQTSLWGRQICPRSKPSAPGAHAHHPGQGFTTGDHGATRLHWHQPQQVPFSSSHLPQHRS